MIDKQSKEFREWYAKEKQQLFKEVFVKVYEKESKRWNNCEINNKFNLMK